jgi:hypothetical protein
MMTSRAPSFLQTICVSAHDLKQWGNAASGVVEAAWAALSCIPGLVNAQLPASIIQALGINVFAVNDVQGVRACGALIACAHWMVPDLSHHFLANSETRSTLDRRQPLLLAAQTLTSCAPARAWSS